jgi:small conductance mechanosensitive channel
MHKRNIHLMLLGLPVFALLSFWASLSAEETTPSALPPQPVTTAEPAIPVDELVLLIQPLTTDELFVEADAWLALLKAKVTALSQAEIEMKRKNRLRRQPRESDAGVSPKGSAGATAQPKSGQTDATAGAMAKSKSGDKSEMLSMMNALREERTSLIDRLNVVLEELNAKLGKTATGTDHEKVVPYRRYALAVGSLNVDISDTQTTYATFVGWLKSSEGGIRWARNIGAFLAIVLAFWILGVLLSNVAERALRLSRRASVLLRNFAVRAVRSSLLIIGILVGLSALEVNIGPLLAVVGAVSFAVAFALQGTLSNFASGLMIMFYKPFDVGAVINVAGLVGVVQSMSLVNTTMTTFDNQVMIVPNNAIWGNPITNITGSEERRVDLVFGIRYSDDIDRAQQILEAIVSDHPLVLDEPKPIIKLDELAESSVNFICRPWTKTSNFGQVRWDIIRAVKDRFDQAGISMSFPQRDVHVYNTAVSAAPEHTEPRAEKAPSRHAPDGAGETANP